jgi:hypothetical protein
MKVNIIKIIFECRFPTSQITELFCITKSNQLQLFNEIIAVY